mgnify:CR=1 FL=1
MSDAIAFEFRGKTIGVLARSGDAFVFYSGAEPYHALDGALFAEPHDLHLALRRLEDEQRRRSNRHGDSARASFVASTVAQAAA